MVILTGGDYGRSRINTGGDDIADVFTAFDEFY